MVVQFHQALPKILGFGAAVAQLALNQKVEGSNPSIPAMASCLIASVRPKEVGCRIRRVQHLKIGLRSRGKPLGKRHTTEVFD